MRLLVCTFFAGGVVAAIIAWVLYDPAPSYEWQTAHWFLTMAILWTLAGTILAVAQRAFKRSQKTRRFY